jgi:ATP-dependent Clp protease ATP-binding subunit ClpC
MDNFTNTVRGALTLAAEEARSLGVPAVDTDHLLIGMLLMDSCPATLIIEHLTGGRQKIVADSHKAIVQGGNVEGNVEPIDSEKIELTDGCAAVLMSASELAAESGQSWYGTEHILQAILKQDKSGAAATLHSAGVNLENVTKCLEDMRSGKLQLTPNS